MLKKGNDFQFEHTEKGAFEQLKRALTKNPVLGIYKQGGEMELHTDACKEGYEAILFQRSFDDNAFHPIYSASWKTSDAEKKYISYELEVLAIIGALKKFKIYLLGTRSKIVTDCSAFQKTMDKKRLNYSNRPMGNASGRI